ncbi:hypothetical protein Sango_1546000 [Sesamum angolense]|uniref:CCHC-type domain-containing protein n=1 Tax=Sesamum angolense TaxID=2727404 RepID=A0AAE1WPW5_9LAMI|nr:hypothetical protein Sango_1546000 [Sesamum angolense]
MDSGLSRLQSALSLTETEDDGVVIASNLWNRFLLKFNHIIDRNRVLDGCPWSFEKNLLVLSPIGTNENPSDVNLDWADFHVHANGLPLSKMTKEVACLIGNHLGRFVDVDMDAAGHVWGSSMRIRVSMDLPNFCYLCGCLGHISKYCELCFSDDFIDPGDATPFGPWLRATNHSTGRNRSFTPHRVPAAPSFFPPSHTSSSHANSPAPHKQPSKGTSIFGSFTPPTSPRSRNPEFSKLHTLETPAASDPGVDAPPQSPRQIAAIELPSHPTLHLETTLNSFIHAPSLPFQSLSAPLITSISFPSSIHTPPLLPATHSQSQNTMLSFCCTSLKAKKPTPRKVISVSKKRKQAELPSSLSDLCTTPIHPANKNRQILSDISNGSAEAAWQPRREQ